MTATKVWYPLSLPKAGGGQRSHLFTDADVWHPLRETACGREYDTHALVKPKATDKLCRNCEKEVDGA